MEGAQFIFQNGYVNIKVKARLNYYIGGSAHTTRKKFQNTTTRCKSFLSSVKNQINTQHIQLKHEGNRPCLLMSSKLQD